ncbi:methylmalonyl-CoA epimerase, mitochondrial-like [Rhopilema esculentum]|uniref:methylmalonyl-CoA epimerase, mitochondrial-like n=1 Tax=Rhopilema esculentum TaxID=499914 RepID=UPI0031D91142
MQPLVGFIKMASRLGNVLRSGALLQAFRRSFHASSCLLKENPWELGKLNHVAIAVPDMEKACKLYKDAFKANVSEKVPQPEHGVYTVFVELGNTKIELLSVYGENSPIAGFFKKNPAGGIHHICIEVDDVRQAMESMKENNIRVLDKEPKIGAHGKPVVFLHPKDCGGVLIELEES